MRIALIGYGKMGQAIEQLAIGCGHTISHRVSVDNPQDLVLITTENTDVAIEFSGPEAALAHVVHCLRHRVPVVSGTTGWLDHKSQADEFCLAHEGAFLYSANFSIGVNIFLKLNQVLATLMNSQPHYQVRLEETHHTEKKDSPSGTALAIAADILRLSDQFTSLAAQDEYEKIPLGTIPIRSYRIPDVPGTHVVTYQSDIDVIEIRHDARSRRGFAQGALLAAEWLPGKTGVFAMTDLLSL